MVKAIGIAVLLCLAAGCSEAPWSGTYSASGTWRLSGPLEGGRTVGDAAADLLVDQIAGAVPVPSFLEDKLHDLLYGSIRNEIKATVDAAAPKDLAPGGSLARLLGESLATVKLESTITLEGDSDELEGEENVTAIEYLVRGQPRRISAGDLGGASIVATWAGKETAPATLGIEPHSLTIRYGALVRRVLGDLAGAAELSTLDGNLQSALGCRAIVAALVDGGAGLRVSFLGWSHTISAATLEGLCESAMSVARGRTMGQFDLESPVEVGGPVSWSAVAGTESVELRSGPEFGGTVNVLPKAVAPKLTVAFTARRQ